MRSWTTWGWAALVQYASAMNEAVKLDLDSFSMQTAAAVALLLQTSGCMYLCVLPCDLGNEMMQAVCHVTHVGYAPRYGGPRMCALEERHAHSYQHGSGVYLSA
eukprot:2043176-Amphidinium_carterae.2